MVCWSGLLPALKLNIQDSRKPAGSSRSAMVRVLAAQRSADAVSQGSSGKEWGVCCKSGLFREAVGSQLTSIPLVYMKGRWQECEGWKVISVSGSPHSCGNIQEPLVRAAFPSSSSSNPANGLNPVSQMYLHYLDLLPHLALLSFSLTGLRTFPVWNSAYSGLPS